MQTQAQLLDHDLVVRAGADRGVGVVAVSGEVDVATEHHLRPALVRALAGTGSALVLDLTGLDFCSAHGVRLLADITAAVAHRGNIVAVAGMSRLQAQMWALTGLPVPPRYATAGQAVTELTRPGLGAARGRGLHHALAAGVRAEQAKGQLMEQLSCTPAEASQLLAQAARTRHEPAAASTIEVQSS